MSKIGKKPIIIPSGVMVNIDRNVVTISKGEKVRVYTIPSYLSVSMEDNLIVLSIPSTNLDPAKYQRAMFGTSRQHLNNMIIGLNEGFSRELIIHGIGFEVIDEVTNIALRLGFSHTINWVKKPELAYKVDGRNRLTISGVDKYTVNQEAANIRALRKHSVYQKFGIKYSDEVIVFKSVDTRRSKAVTKK